jgi:hypothetical protein
MRVTRDVDATMISIREWAAVMYRAKFQVLGFVRDVWGKFPGKGV